MQANPTLNGVIYCKNTYPPAVLQQLINPTLYVLDFIAPCAELHCIIVTLLQLVGYYKYNS